MAKKKGGAGGGFGCCGSRPAGGGDGKDYEDHASAANANGRLAASGSTTPTGLDPRDDGRAAGGPSPRELFGASLQTPQWAAITIAQWTGHREDAVRRRRRPPPTTAREGQPQLARETRAQPPAPAPLHAPPGSSLTPPPWPPPPFPAPPQAELAARDAWERPDFARAAAKPPSLADSKQRLAQLGPAPPWWTHPPLSTPPATVDDTAAPADASTAAVRAPARTRAEQNGRLFSAGGPA